MWDLTIKLFVTGKAHRVPSPWLAAIERIRLGALLNWRCNATPNFSPLHHPSLEHNDIGMNVTNGTDSSYTSKIRCWNGMQEEAAPILLNARCSSSSSVSLWLARNGPSHPTPRDARWKGHMCCTGRDSVKKHTRNANLWADDVVSVDC